jgi:hypothetical protein
MLASHTQYSPNPTPLCDLPGPVAGMTQELANLLDEHHDLDTVIAVLLATGSDDLLVGRFKKRKLQIKDRIAAIQCHGPQAHAA